MILQILKFGIGAGLVGAIAVGTLMLPETGLRLSSNVQDSAANLSNSSEDSQLEASGLLGLHQQYVERFAQTQDFGVERMPRMHHFSNLPTVWTDQNDGSSWQIKSYKLVGVLKADHPVVYVDNRPPIMVVNGDFANTRLLDDFEGRSLAELRSGKELVVDRTNPSRLRMLGALRAIGTCTNCHHEPEGSLLGAFTYDLERMIPGG
ncbi:MAG TPA: hypothetical protein VGZ25_15685 [Gemmataceae bacterium]|nr:hypothetical protein [Gemmataceae bacterium]